MKMLISMCFSYILLVYDDPTIYICAKFIFDIDKVFSHSS